MATLAPEAIATTATLDTIIDGAPHSSTSGRFGTVWNPATGEAHARVNFASVEEVDAAVASGKAAFPGWRATPLSKRSEILFRLRSLVDQNREPLARVLSTENGKTLADARGEIARGLENLEFACGIPSLLKGAYSEQVSSGVDVYQIRQPLGVVAGITPFNFPAMVPMWMFPFAIACGNSFILKPSEKVPMTPTRTAELLHDSF
jgi:malonate-semialdehyde dehydrogenase (acetylating)/methylmalonate-semialdehyde dehydrogenase